jgi:ketosteroid isomerase-like protein
MKTLLCLRVASLPIIFALIGTPSLLSQDRDAESGLRQTVDRFIAAADKGDTKTITAMYDPEFANVRVADDGGVVKLTREQVLQLLERLPATPFPTKETKVHHVETTGDHGFVLLIRIKDLGQGWEPMFYSLVWKKHDGDWRLLREFVHQRTLPKPR